MSDDAQRLIDESYREELLTTQEYAEVFRCSRRAVHYAVKAGTIPFPILRPTGKQIFIRVPLTLLRQLRCAS